MKGGNLQAGSSPAPTYRGQRRTSAYAGRQAGTGLRRSPVASNTVTNRR